MKRYIFLICILLNLFCSNIAFAQVDSTKKKERLENAIPLTDFTISLVRLIATPEKYHGKTIQVVGYLNLEFEGNAIYLHEEDYQKSLLENAFWVEFSETITKGKKLQNFSKKYVIIVGTFDMNGYGHMGLFGGTIKNITRLDEWR